MDGHLNKEIALRPKGLRIAGRISHAIPFAERHMRDEAYLSWLRDKDVVRTLNLPAYMAGPIDVAAVEVYCEQMINSSRDLFLALYHTADEKFVGTIKAGHIDWHHGVADIGIMIGSKSHWGRGLATDAIGALALHLFEVCGLRRLTAGAMAINPAMIAVFENLGFRREGILRSHDRIEKGLCDHILLGCLRSELELTPAVKTGQQ